MICSICKTGKMEKGLTTVTINKDECIIIFKNVPADICDNCGEYYLDEETTNSILKKSKKAVQSGAEVEIIRYVA